MKKLLVLTLLLTVPVAYGQEKKKKLKPGTYAHFETSQGNFSVELFERQEPRTVENFIGLAEGTKDWKDPRSGQAMKGKRYFDGTIFHRVVNGFMLQGGDPTGTGMGGPGYSFADEFARGMVHDREGRLSMANAGPNTNGSQFFVTLAPTPFLDNKHSVFGQVVDGMDIVKKIGKVKVKQQPGGGENSRPVEDVVIKKVTIERVAS